jgi:electron transport complex protein RnfE
MKKTLKNIAKNFRLSIGDFMMGLVKENPIFVAVLGICPTLAVTTSVENALGMGVAVTFVLTCSNIIISILKSGIPAKIRIPSFIVVIASFTTVIELLIAGFVPELNNSLGIFIPLIAVNCVIFARAEAFASKNNVLRSMFDGLGMGVGFTGALVIVGAIREILGEGQFWGVDVMWATYEPMIIAILAPGAFITLGLLLAIMNVIRTKKSGGN